MISVIYNNDNNNDNFGHKKTRYSNRNENNYKMNLCQLKIIFILFTKKKGAAFELHNILY